MEENILKGKNKAKITKKTNNKIQSKKSKTKYDETLNNNEDVTEKNYDVNELESIKNAQRDDKNAECDDEILNEIRNLEQVLKDNDIEVENRIQSYDRSEILELEKEINNEYLEEDVISNSKDRHEKQSLNENLKDIIDNIMRVHTKVILETIRTENSRILETVGKIYIKQKEIENNIIKLNEINDGLIKEHNEIRKNIRDLAEIINSHSEILFDENRQLKEQLKQVEVEKESIMEEMIEMNQYNRINNLEIIGIPEQKDENCEKIIENLGRKLNIEIKEYMIDTVHRLGFNKKYDRKIIVKFTQRKIKNDILRAKKNIKINTKDLGYEENRFVYINEHLCFEKARLFKIARERKQLAEWKYVWTNNGKINIRQEDGTRIFTIKSQKQLEELMEIKKQRKTDETAGDAQVEMQEKKN